MEITTSIIGVPNSVGGYENFEFKEYANAIGAMFRSNKDTERINLIEVDAAAGRTNAGASFALGLPEVTVDAFFAADLPEAAVAVAVGAFLLSY